MGAARRRRVLFVSELTARRTDDVRIPDAHRRRYGDYGEHFDMTWTLTERHDGGLQGARLPDGVDVVWLPAFSSGLRWLATAPRVIVRLHRAVVRHDAVLVNAPSLAALPALAVARLRGVPAVTLQLSRWAQLRRHPGRRAAVVDGLLALAAQASVLLARHSYVTGQALRREVWRPLRGRVTTVVYPGIADADVVDAATPTPPSSDGCLRLLTVARFIDTKRLDVLLRCAAELRRRGHDVRLVMVGDGVERAALESLARELGLADVVSMPGWIDDWEQLRAHYLAASAFVFASEDEGLPLVVQEAMAHALPVVSTPAGGLASWLHHDVDALVVPRSEPGLLADAVERLHRDPALRARLVDQALERVRPLTREAWLAWLADQVEDLVQAADGRARPGRDRSEETGCA